MATTLRLDRNNDRDRQAPRDGHAVQLGGEREADVRALREQQERAPRACGGGERDASSHMNAVVKAAKSQRPQLAGRDASGPCLRRGERKREVQVVGHGSTLQQRADASDALSTGSPGHAQTV